MSAPAHTSGDELMPGSAPGEDGIEEDLRRTGDSGGQSS
jgi:hypothetical protein